MDAMDGRATEARNFKGNLRRDDSGAEVAAVPFPASAALVACPIHDLDTSGDSGGGDGGAPKEEEFGVA